MVSRNAIIAGSKDGTIWMWLSHNGQCVQVFAGHDGGVSCGEWAQRQHIYCGYIYIYIFLLFLHLYRERVRVKKRGRDIHIRQRGLGRCVYRYIHSSLSFCVDLSIYMSLRKENGPVYCRKYFYLLLNSFISVIYHPVLLQLKLILAMQFSTLK